ncbi:M56 family metallopeptidase [Nonomuraea soli]|uniref:Zn-dependent protease with chaperone function n=1 Tax=Nonomuraea soli TaxID=1032476 RepID=A0A7W0CIW2_9ACTN|nr:M56 family metallopeptidase [Nonomuraea soli]MBA2891740.1 Zn-dependent protease with chaperone function [Nonomuraea soli]
MRCLDAGGRAFWQLVALAVTALSAFALIADFLPTALTLWFGGTAAAPPEALLAVTVLTCVAWAVLATAVRALRRTSRATRRLHRDLRAGSVDAPALLTEVAAEAGVRRIRLVADPRPWALTYGVRRPRVAVSTGLVEALTREELAAVLAHEQSHVECRDPLRVLLSTALTLPGFFLPALPALRHRFVVGRELAADRRAIAGYGRRALAGALLKAVEVPHACAAGAAAMAEPSALDARLIQLESGTQEGLPAVGGPRLALSLLALVVLGVTAAATSGFMHEMCAQALAIFHR